MQALVIALLSGATLLAATCLHAAGAAGWDDQVASLRDVAPATRGQVPAALGEPLAGSALDALRGGDSHVSVEVRNHGEVGGNSADGAVSGINTIGDGAFGNASGIVTVIQNSGANVLIQNGTSVNVQFVDPTP